MSTVGQIERATQRRVVELLTGRLGYRYLGNWQDRPGNANVEEAMLADWLRGRGYSDKVIGKALHQLGQAKAVGGSKNLYDANGEVYRLLRYGVKVQPEAGEQHETVWLVDWKHPEANDFAVAEEVALAGVNDKRPDVVLYVNGVALGILELKRSTVSVSEGIRQNLDNQKRAFVRPFFATVQLLMAGNDSEGLRYGVIETKERYYLTWKEDDPAVVNPLDRALSQVCRKERLLELVHNFMVFDAGVKKTCRPNQYFGVKAAQGHVGRREGGILWHTQGSGKSLTMVWLAKWIRELGDDRRVLLITDRKELDEQIERVFLGVNEEIYRTKSGSDLVNVLAADKEWLICSLIHKFGTSDDADVAAFVGDLRDQLPAGFRAAGELFVFVDECHRTQSGALHEAMKAILPGATFIGFTGTPLLKQDKQRSIEVFGPYIHTYKYDEAVRDRVVLDLRYEARDIDQSISNQGKVDQWFDSKTKGLNDVAKAQLKQRWGTMQRVLGSQSRLDKIVADILMDMETRDRLASGRGNAMLVSGSISSACRIFDLFQKTDLAGRCAIVTSYRPSAAEIKGEESGEGLTEKLRQYETYRRMLAAHFDEPEETAAGKIELFEEQVKKRFVHEPGQMKLLIVVDKLLTGFDAPSATYLYIDKQMRDHALFQAICRVNRLDDDDKEYGYVVDYKDLFRSLERSITDYTGDALDGYDAEDVAGLLTDRLAKGRERLEEAGETVRALCEPVEPPRDSATYIRYFCGDTSDPEALRGNEAKRLALYKAAAAYLRAYANLANEMEGAGYTDEAAAAVEAEVSHYEKVREEVKLASGDYIDLKLYEPAMRHLLNNYIRAEESETVSTFEDLTLVELIVARGPEAVESLPKGIKADKEAAAETVENNVRKVIIDSQTANPKYFARMSDLLDALIRARKEAALEYQEYLRLVADLATQVTKPELTGNYPTTITSAGLRALYDNLDGDEELALELDHAVREARRDDWRGNKVKEREVRGVVYELVPEERGRAIFETIKNQYEY